MVTNRENKEQENSVQVNVMSSTNNLHFKIKFS